MEIGDGIDLFDELLGEKKDLRDFLDYLQAQIPSSNFQLIASDGSVISTDNFEEIPPELLDRLVNKVKEGSEFVFSELCGRKYVCGIYVYKFRCILLCELSHMQQDLSKNPLGKYYLQSQLDLALLKIEHHELLIGNEQADKRFKAFEQHHHNLLEENFNQNKLIQEKDKEYANKLEIEIAKRTEELQETNRQLVEASQTKSEFLANMSHEIRTPMNAILGMANLALKQQLAPKVKNYLHIINDSGRSLLDIINSILDFSKIEAGKLEIEHTDFDFYKLMDGITDLFSAKIAEKRGVEMFVAVHEDVPSALIGDPLRLKQILVNLTNNAINFTEKGEIIVSVDCSNQSADQVTLEFSVKDTGIGISKDKVDTLFESFSQADTSTTRKYGGTGLGLAICQNLVELMDGHIDVESELDKGSTFRFTVAFDVQSDKVQKKFTLPTPLIGLKVLVVDDNPTVRKTMSVMLESFACEVETAAGGKDALELLSASLTGSKPFDLVITDLMMPEMDGIELSEKIRSTPSFEEVPIIMISALGNDEELKKAGTAAVDIFINKPIKRGQLFNTILALFLSESAGRGELDQYNLEKQKIYFADKKILLAEDNAINQQIAQEILENMGIELQIANNGKEAVNLLQNSTFDAVLMDIQMPEMDGMEATRQIRKDPVFAELPIIAMTAHALQGYREKCIEAGMNDYVTKPIDEDGLFLTLKKWLNVSDARKSGKSGQPTTISKPVKSSGDSSLPSVSLPVMDLEKALKNVAGNEELLVKLLKEFSQDYSTSHQKIRDALKDDNLEEAHRLAHTIKGIAGSFSAGRLQSIAYDLELTLKDNKLDTIESLLENFQTSLDEVFDSIAALDEQEKDVEQNETKTKEGTAGDIQQIVTDLADRLKENDFEAISLFKSLKVGLSGASLADCSASLENLETQIGAFDYKKSYAALVVLADQLGIKLS